jgi:hypothetical protein
MKTIVWKSVLGGAITGWICAGFGIGIALLGRVLLDWSKGATATCISVFGLLGCMLGGFRSGLLSSDAPFSNGAVAGILTTFPLGLFGLVQNGRILNFVFALMVGALVGTFGAMVSKGSNRGSSPRSNG